MAVFITIPRSVAYQARVRLIRAQELVDSFCELFDLVASLFKHMPAAQNEEALTIRRAWLRASA